MSPDPPFRPDDVCPLPEELSGSVGRPLSPPLYLATVYRCDSPDQADALLSGEEPGYVYSRDGHPNAHLLAEKCRHLHGLPQAAITASGMGALAAALLSQLQHGDHLVVARQLYGRSLRLLCGEAGRLGIEASLVDGCDLEAVAKACTPRTRLVVVETLSNPVLQVADLAGLAEIAHARGAKLLVDNTFASPAICRPAMLGADLVLESLTKVINGHSDVLLGMLAGTEESWARVPEVITTWGLTGSPFECWLAARGMATLHLRVERACANALTVARFLKMHPEVQRVDYPGLEEHPGHRLAQRQFGDRFGWMVTFHLAGGRAAVERFIAGSRIPFCPSLGELCTTLSHPASTSHRALPAERLAELQISEGTIRLSVGTESAEYVLGELEEALRGLR